MKLYKKASLVPFLFLSALAAGCAESDDEILLRLKTEIESGQKEKAITEINHTLIDLNEDFSETLRSSSLPRKFVRNRSGSVTAWIEGDRVYFFNGKLDSVSLDENGTDLQISNNGKYGLVHAVTEDLCLLYPFSMETGTEFPEIALDKCEGRAAVMDNGEVWFPQNKKIFKKSDIESEEVQSEEILDIKNFSIKYKKLNNHFYLFSASENLLLIFYGTAGYYNLYSYNTDNSKLNLISKSPVKPVLYWTQKKDVLFPEMSNSGNKYDAWIFTGSAGKYTLSPIQISSKPKMGKSEKNPPMANFIPLGETGKYYIIDKSSSLARFDSRKNSLFSFPIKATSLIMLDSGLLYNDENESLKYRNLPFGEFEKNLLDLKESAEEN
ncbi:MAG: hypothetical protein OEZ34_11005 [Spirochaetia bacterium]|nr:hypothetical protein [Spirochaetia bacterium]